MIIAKLKEYARVLLNRGEYSTEELRGVFTGGFDKTHIAKCAGLILLCWLPYMILLFPGVLTYDPIWQIMQDLGSGALANLTPAEPNASFSAHKPIMHTWLLGVFILFGETIGSQSAGLYVMMLLQCVCTACSLSTMCSYLARLQAPIWLRRVALLFCCVFPFIPIYAMSGFNDAVFGWLYVFWFLCVIEVVYSGTHCIEKASFTTAFALLGLLLSLMKTAGVYLVLLTVVTLALVYRRQLDKFLIVAALPAFVLFLVMPFVVYPLANVANPTSKEAFGTLFQATAAYVREYPGEVTREEQDAIDKVLVYDELADKYDPQCQDPVKKIQRIDSEPEDVFVYVGVWLSMGAKHPVAYARSVVRVVAPFFRPDSPFEYYLDETPWNIAKYMEGLPQNGGEKLELAKERFDVSNPVALDAGKHFLRRVLDRLSAIPLFGWLLGMGVYATWLPVLFVCGLVIARREWMPVGLPVALSLCLLLISPLAMSRYALPLVLTWPAMMGVLLSKVQPLRADK